MSTPELNDLNYRLVNNLFDKNYILLSVGMITDFVHWVDKVKSDFEENGIEVLNSIYTDSINILEKNAKNQISDTMDTTIEYIQIFQVLVKHVKTAITRGSFI